jgi:8-oxo-dGTP diphosphatase
MSEARHQGALQRRMGSGALFRDAADRVLLVQPAYKSAWEIPGGAIEPGEAPRACCRRELREELGLGLEVGRLLVIDWLPPADALPDGWMFVFDGGVLTVEQADRITLPPDELLDWRFVPLDEIDSYVSEFKARRLRVAHACALKEVTMDLEWGYETS